MNQLSMFQPIDEKAVRRAVVRELQKLRVLRVRLENQKECMEAGVDNLFPALGTTTDHDLRARQIERALERALDEEQKRLIEKKYLQPQKVKDLTVLEELGMTGKQYYKVKKEAIYDLATALRII